MSKIRAILILIGCSIGSLGLQAQGQGGSPLSVVVQYGSNVKPTFQHINQNNPVTGVTLIIDVRGGNISASNIASVTLTARYTPSSSYPNAVRSFEISYGPSHTKSQTLGVSSNNFSAAATYSIA